MNGAAKGGPSSYEPTVGAALHRALAEGSDADGGWQHRAADVGNEGGVISIGESVYCHYAFDMWMARRCPHIPFERYADDAICHCKSAEEAQVLWSALAVRFAACKLVLHPEKTKIVYARMRMTRRFPIISFDFLGFQFRARKTMWREGTKRIFAHSFQPAASPKALTFISRTIRRWTLHHSSDKSLPNWPRRTTRDSRLDYLLQHIYRTQLRSTLKRIDRYVSACAANSNGCVSKPKEHATGLIGFAAQIRRSSLIGSCAMETAEHREPCESRGSRTDLGAPGGEIPPGDSTIATIRCAADFGRYRGQ